MPIPKVEEYCDWLARLYPEYPPGMLAKSVTFQVTDDCNLACSYCYQTHKGKRRMSLDVAKKLVDLLLIGDKGIGSYIDPVTSPGIILDFIGGEPLLEITLIDQIVDYFRGEALRLNHPWADKFRVGICSNGVLYNDPEVQRVLTKHRNHMSFSVTLDGNKELHDMCRLFPDGKPSYDIAVAAIKDWMSNGFYMGSKITVAPANVSYVYEASKHMVDLGYREININCVYEDGWEISHAQELYKQLKQFADYVIDNDVDELYYAFFNEDNYKKLPASDNKNWCGGNGVMLACDPDGVLYPCLRYMESSLGDDQEPYIIGDVDNGLAPSQCHKDRLSCLGCITRKSQSTDECFDCPIGAGCSWCTAYNYQVNGTPNSRVINICDMHKAASLANAYFWNKYYKKQGDPRIFAMNCPKEWAVPIIGEDEYAMLEKLSKR
ncbi:uncharacterized protein M2140_001918 [Clostridiales Family XIII bacterium PM5-7]